MRISTKSGPRLFLPVSELKTRLDVPDDVYSRAVELLTQAEILTPHRRESSPARGFTLPEDWQEVTLVPHIARIARRLLREDGVELVTRDGRARLGQIFVS
jgi:hypothetical protein